MFLHHIDCMQKSISNFIIYIDVNGNVYSADIPLSSVDSSFDHSAAAIAKHYQLAFKFHQVPITAGLCKVRKHVCTLR